MLQTVVTYAANIVTFIFLYFDDNNCDLKFYEGRLVQPKVSYVLEQ